jgi:hypothetical protein
MSENGDASAPAPVVDRDLQPYSMRAFLNGIHLDDLSLALIGNASAYEGRGEGPYPSRGISDQG